MRPSRGRCEARAGGSALLAWFIAAAASAQTPTGGEGWRADWGVEPGFAIDVDTEGYRYPTAIAFVPHPGPRPDDPLYFVTEIGGRIRVVTNDRSVHTFADSIFLREVSAELPAGAGESGLAGICLEPERGLVFATFAFLDSEGILRNDVIRFDTEPDAFALRPRTATRFTQVFATDRAGVSHQVGSCQVHDGALYVSVGDGVQSFHAQNLDSTLGKILRLTLDGAPHPDNPFRDADPAPSTRDYVWAYGFRNPFSLDIANGRVFVADNGLNVDRFLHVARGANALWDGSDWSLGVGADMLFTPALSPVQMDHLAPGDTLFPPEHRGRFYMATAGILTREGTGGRRGAKGVVSLPYDFGSGSVTDVPQTFLGYRGSGNQGVTGLAFGADGLYVVPLLPQNDGRSVILRVSAAPPDRAHPFSVSDWANAETGLGERGCYACHSVGRDRAASIGPALDRDSLLARLLPRLESDSFRATLARLDERTDAPFPRYREARARLREARGLDAVRLFVTLKIEEPRFANPAAQMPALGVPAEEAALIADYLLAGALPEEPPGVQRRIVLFIQRFIPRLRYRHLVFAFVLGALLPLVVLAARRRRRP